MVNVQGSFRSLIAQESYLQGKSKKPILQFSLNVFLEVTEVVRVSSNCGSAERANVSRHSSSVMKLH